MNMEYFGNEAKKSKDRPNILEKVTKATSKTGCVVQTIHELAGSLLRWRYTKVISIIRAVRFYTIESIKHLT